MANKTFKTVNLRPDTKTELEELKVHPNQSFDEVIRYLMEEVDNE